MKKRFAALLAGAMLASLSVTAFAAENTGATPTEITVNGKYTPGTTTGEIISADIAWDAMDFTYSQRTAPLRAAKLPPS